jgi:hypothetical protein
MIYVKKTPCKELLMRDKQFLEDELAIEALNHAP